MDIIEFCARMDMVNRADEVVQDLFHLPQGWHKIHVSRAGGWRGIDVERLLWHYRIPIWGRGFTAESLYFNVPGQQAKWAVYILMRAKVQVMSAPPDERIAAWAAPYAGPPPAWADAPAPCTRARPVDKAQVHRPRCTGPASRSPALHRRQRQRTAKKGWRKWLEL